MILSPSPPPQLAQPIDPQPAIQLTDTPPTDPNITSLKAIFPDFDDAVIISVLESTHNDHDRALDVLLGMNDPSFVPSNPPPAPPPNEFHSTPSADAQRLSQEALDEQLARRLALEEQQAANQPWPPQGLEGQAIYQPYQSRHGGRNSWGGQPQGQPQTQGQGGRDTMTEVQEGFNRIAESGKKTFSSLMSKVRAKMQEFDQGQGWSWSQSQSQQPGLATSSTPVPQQLPAQGAYTQPTQPAQPTFPQRQASQSRPTRTNTYTSSPPRSGVSRPAATEPPSSVSPQEPSYYDPNTRGYDLYDDDEDEIQLHDRRTPSIPPAAPPAAPPPPHADNAISTMPPSDASSPPSYASPVSPPTNTGVPLSTSPPARSLSPTTAGARSTTPGAPGGVDFSKLGLLPKRPISLVQAQPLPTTGAGTGTSLTAPRMATAHSESTTDSSTEYEEPEFVENPFEDHR